MSNRYTEGCLGHLDLLPHARECLDAARLALIVEEALEELEAVRALPVERVEIEELLGLGTDDSHAPVHVVDVDREEDVVIGGEVEAARPPVVNAHGKSI